MTHTTDAELLRDIEEHMRKMWDARLLPAVCWPTELAQRLTQAVRRAPAGQAQRAPLTDEEISSLAAGPCWAEDGVDIYLFARAIEKAHGIKD